MTVCNEKCSILGQITYQNSNKSCRGVVDIVNMLQYFKIGNRDALITIIVMVKFIQSPRPRMYIPTVD